MMCRYLYSSGDTATCLYNAPHEDEALPRVLPGKLLSLDAQCRKDRGTSACFVSFALQRRSTCIFFIHCIVGVMSMKRLFHVLERRQSLCSTILL